MRSWRNRRASRTPGSTTSRPSSSAGASICSTASADSPVAACSRSVPLAHPDTPSPRPSAGSEAAVPRRAPRATRRPRTAAAELEQPRRPIASHLPSGSARRRGGARRAARRCRRGFRACAARSPRPGSPPSPDPRAACRRPARRGSVRAGCQQCVAPRAGRATGTAALPEEQRAAPRTLAPTLSADQRWAAPDPTRAAPDGPRRTRGRAGARRTIRGRARRGAFCCCP